MSYSTKHERNSEFVRIAEEVFGEHLARDIRAEDEICKHNEITHLKIRNVHPLILPTYQKLLTKDLPIEAWVVIYEKILLCKTVYKSKLPSVYRTIYENLTWKRAADTSFDLLPPEEKHLWYENYAAELENTVDEKKAAKEFKNCTRIVQELAQFCERALQIEVPGLDRTEFFERVNLEELSKRHTPKQRNEYNLQQELRDVEESSDDDIDCKLNQFDKRQTDQDQSYCNNHKRPNKIHRPPPSNPEYSEEQDQSVTEAFFYPTFIGKQSSPIESDKKKTKMTAQVRITDFLPKKYNPKCLENDAEAHILGFRDYLCAQLGIQDPENEEIPPSALDLFKFTVTGEARLWYETNSPFETIDELERKFLKEYAPDLRSRSTAARALSQMQFSPHSKLCTFVNKMMRLNRTLNYNDQVLKDRFMTAMPANIRQMANLTNPSSLKECIEAVRNILEDSSSGEQSNIAMIANNESEIKEISLSMRSIQKDIDTISKQINDKQMQPRYQNQRDPTNRYYDQRMPMNRYQNQREPMNRFQYQRAQPNQFTRAPGNNFTKYFQGPRPLTRQERPGNLEQREARDDRRQQQAQQRFQPQQRPFQSQGKRNIICFCCKKRGHYAAECWYRPDRYQNCQSQKEQM